MKYIALTGHIATGKTAVAKALQAKGYILVSYTDYLKEIVAAALTSVGIRTSLDDILAEKERYRALIQAFGSVIGFDSGVPYLDDALYRSGWVNARVDARVVLDNVRTDDQAKIAEQYGFTVVELTASHPTRAARLQDAGKDTNAVFSTETHPIESGLSDEMVDMRISTDSATPEMLADFLASFPDDAPGDMQEDDEEDDEDEDPTFIFEGHPDDARTFLELATEPANDQAL